MGLWFELSFKEIKGEALNDYLIDLAEQCVHGSYGILEENVVCAPSVIYKELVVDEERYRNFWAGIDTQWLYKIFSLNFVYWPDKSLLGITGNLPETVKEQLTTIEFQSKHDHDYSYDDWTGIRYFEEIVNSVKKADVADVLKYLNCDGDNYSAGDIVTSLDYYKRSAVYYYIYDRLDLQNWFFDKKGKFKIFSIQPITDQNIGYKLYLEMEAIKKECRKMQ